MKSARPIRVLSGLARSGCTLLSRCLGSMDDVILLSEIHPRGISYFNPLWQAYNWYGLQQTADINMPGYDFTGAIDLVEQHCRTTDKTLVLRDWAHLDYIGVPFLEKPEYSNALVKVLTGSYNVLQIALVRNPIDQWLSTVELEIMRNHLDLDAFLLGYRRFAEHAVSCGFIRYEDFTSEPESQMEWLCKQLQLGFNPDFINKWQENKCVTGDTRSASRGSQLDEIRPIQRRISSMALLKKFRDNANYWRAIDMLGYIDSGNIS